MNMCHPTRRRYQLVIVALFIIAPVVPAQVRLRPPAIVTRYCSGCHETNGLSSSPYVPRLAGLQAQYMETRFASYKAASPPPVDEAFEKLVAIRHPARPTGLTYQARVQMIGVARNVSIEEARVALEWYAGQRPNPVRTRETKETELGRSLYANGVPHHEVSACQTCHGSAAQGSAIAPRLAGQNARYVASQLALFQAGERPNSPMTEIARGLEDCQVQALAAYLQTR